VDEDRPVRSENAPYQVVMVPSQVVEHYDGLQTNWKATQEEASRRHYALKRAVSSHFRLGAFAAIRRLGPSRNQARGKKVLFIPVEKTA